MSTWLLSRKPKCWIDKSIILIDKNNNNNKNNNISIKDNDIYNNNYA